MKPLELWGGVAYTVNGVGDGVNDQLQRSGHAARPRLRTFLRILLNEPDEALIAPGSWRDRRVSS